MPAKRKVSQATLDRLREIRRKHGLGEFKTGSGRKARRSSLKRASGKRRRRTGSPGRVFGSQTFAPFRVFTRAGGSGLQFSPPGPQSAPLRSPADGGPAIGSNPRSSSGLRQV